MISGSNIIPIAIVPNKAQITTMTAAKIIDLGNCFAGLPSILLTYGEIFSIPPTANTRMDKLVMYSTLKFGMRFFIDQSMDTYPPFGLMIGAPNIKMM